eukprot:TRINITY_DN32538_c0_g1_i1.p1 TRINITY_DN32538_c0_g1~~TRINITY_DN32538_c0_g1_i1.p1  ORF type:complete len:148 (-),score=37.51 TRINITY_DN32538_c0_g1_i1:40-483(-)
MAERPEDLNLPTSVVTKIIKDCLPNTCKVSKEANAAIAKAASVFVLYATSSANSAAQKCSRKTITGSDVINAMSDMDFEKFVRPLENNLAIWKKSQKDKKDTAAAKKKAVTDKINESDEAKAEANKEEDNKADEQTNNDENKENDES